jgi:hypothetical protein
VIVGGGGRGGGWLKLLRPFKQSRHSRRGAIRCHPCTRTRAVATTLRSRSERERDSCPLRGCMTDAAHSRLQGHPHTPRPACLPQPTAATHSRDVRSRPPSRNVAPVSRCWARAVGTYSPAARRKQRYGHPVKQEWLERRRRCGLPTKLHHQRRAAAHSTPHQAAATPVRSDVPHSRCVALAAGV